MFRIDAIATAIGISTAGSVPKTKNRITSAPAPPIIASVTTLGPVPPPAESAWSGSRPVRLTVTPAGTAALSAARVGLMKLTVVKSGMPAG